MKPSVLLDQPARDWISFEEPHIKDGPRIWSLVQDTGVLDLNSTYTYIMLCKFFPETCVVAKNLDHLVGFVSAFLRPDRRESVFVWQVAVAAAYRGRGLGRQLLRTLLLRRACTGARFLEATISPSNHPSLAMFKGLARDLDTDYEITECFDASLFPESHEPEMMFRVGPLGIGVPNGTVQKPMLRKGNGHADL